LALVEGVFWVQDRRATEVQSVLAQAHVEAQWGAIWRLNDLNFASRRLLIDGPKSAELGLGPFGGCRISA
jgi:hypothetical protein